ncbi:sensor histidine kinase [Streptomyces sp. NPDC101219]|uniref:sensor histidine kinase n=1 Tax=Streptomyces sp. NPDC101219 TaxID=3366131 RepID=UPI00381C0414
MSRFASRIPAISRISRYRHLLRTGRPLPPPVVDLLIAAVVAVLTGSDAAVNDPGYRQADAVTWLLFAVSIGALLVRSRYPVAVTVVTGAACAGWALYGHIGELLNLPVMVALYAVAVQGDRRRTVRTAVIAAVVSGAVSLVAGIDVVQPQGAPLLEMLWPLVPLLLGEAVRGRRELMREYEDRAERAEAEREREARRRVEQERVRIARELHDVVAHTVSAMTVQAGLALDAFDARPEVARAAMRQVRASGKEAVHELRATVGVLRSEGGDLTGPAPRLAELADLAERVRGTGLDVTLRVAAGPLPQVVELAAYRIVQEALTNVIRHADARHARVSVSTEGHRLRVEVTDDGRHGGVDHGRTAPDGGGVSGTGAGGARAAWDGTPGDGTPGEGTGGDGFGLIGMRERAASVGGRLVAGPLPGGGWRVTAELPVGAPAGPRVEGGPGADGGVVAGPDTGGAP